MKILVDAKGFYDYDQRETGGITEEEFEEMDIGGYSKQPSPLPKEHPNSARSNASAKQDEAAKPLSDSPSPPRVAKQPQEAVSRASDATQASADGAKPSMASLGDLPSLF